MNHPPRAAEATGMTGVRAATDTGRTLANVGNLPASGTEIET
jgi:hypothetical protein